MSVLRAGHRRGAYILRRVMDMHCPEMQPGFAGNASAPGRRRMPGAVGAAMWLLYALAALMVLIIAGMVWDLATWGSYVDRVASSVHATAAQVSAEKSDNLGGDVVAILIFAFFAALYLSAALLCRFGLRAGQVMAIVAVAPLLACAIGPFIPGGSSPLEDAAANQQPQLFNVLGAIAALLPLPLGVAVFVLLMTRSGRSFFRRTPPAPSGYIYVPAPWPTGGYGGTPAAWIYPTYGPASQQGQPSVYPPPGYPPTAYPRTPASTGQPASTAGDVGTDEDKGQE
jgi:hypothetical protein